MNACKMIVDFKCGYDINCEFHTSLSTDRPHQCKYSYDGECKNTLAQRKEVDEWIALMSCVEKDNE